MLKVILLIVTIFHAAAENYSPVLIWGTTCASKPALQIVKKFEFTNTISQLLPNYMIVAVLESQLTNRDFLCHKENSTESCFDYMKNVSSKTYYARVEEPVNALELFNATLKRYNFDGFGRLKCATTCHVGTIHLLDFTSTNQFPRKLELQIHDQYIRHLHERYLKNCSVVYLYMSAPVLNQSKQLSLAQRVRVRRQKEESPMQGKLFKKSRLQLYFTKCTLKTLSSGTVKTLQVTEITTTESNLETITVDTSIGDKLNFIIDLTKSSYSIKSFKYNDKVFPITGLSAPMKFSFSCQSLNAYSADGQVLTFHNFQIEVFPQHWDHKKEKFSKAWKYESFLSPALLMGYVVTGLLVGITFIGINMMMDIKSNDKMDNENGPALVIHVRE